ncbi:hypothetical protein DAPPUDRAFT_243830 [Daphnia pulex]|uniref:Uncharacterized protein n=1 Tax=Daphnia pulex TaxID=6669 RepID=E9GJL9_DAPPU|nr:hypothetical protein DAPPUDRAFT_243830 [Daphnia pulex]|eukprot:EFX80134.1 hypothetical protein DAPPUDRAFT_243830 [Daphnia pulex]
MIIKLSGTQTMVAGALALCWHSFCVNSSTKTIYGATKFLSWIADCNAVQIKALITTNDILETACKALFYLTAESPNDVFQEDVDAGLSLFVADNMCRGMEESSTFPELQKLLPALVDLIHNNDGKILADACQALLSITFESDERAQEVSGLDNNDVHVIFTTLRTIGNIGNQTMEQ